MLNVIVKPRFQSFMNKELNQVCTHQAKGFGQKTSVEFLTIFIETCFKIDLLLKISIMASGFTAQRTNVFKPTLFDIEFAGKIESA